MIVICSRRPLREEPGQGWERTEHPAVACLNVEDAGDHASALSDQVEVVPGRPLLDGAALEPPEVPAHDRRTLGLIDQFVEGSFHPYRCCQSLAR